MDASGREPLGNTITPAGVPQRLSQRVGWFFTWNNYPLDARELLMALLPKCKVLIFQSEIGENGTPHLQGMLMLKAKARWSEFGLPNTIHWESLKQDKSARKYCLKDETHDGKIRFEYPEDPMKKILTQHTLRTFQKEIEDLLHTEPDERSIYWYWEPNGNMGKSWFMKYMNYKYEGKVLGIPSTKSADILTVANNETKMYIFDFPRSNETFFPWTALEQLKNGMVADGKLKKQMKLLMFPSPHVVCFSNHEPELDKLSSDRWIVRRIFLDD